MLVKEIRGFAGNRAVFFDDRWINPEKSMSVRDHSLDGFNWGYTGSGPGQLALGILLEFMPPSLALKYYQIFHHQYVARLPFLEDFVLKYSDIQSFIESCLRSAE